MTPIAVFLFFVGGAWSHHGTRELASVGGQHRKPIPSCPRWLLAPAARPSARASSLSLCLPGCVWLGQPPAAILGPRDGVLCPFCFLRFTAPLQCWEPGDGFPAPHFNKSAQGMGSLGEMGTRGRDPHTCPLSKSDMQLSSAVPHALVYPGGN